MTLRRLLVLSILLLLMAGCGPTATPAAPTAVPATAAGVLPETTSLQDMLGGELSVRHPSGWATKVEAEAIRIQLATSPELLTVPDSPLSAGQIQVIVSATPPEIAQTGIAAGATLSPKTFLEALLVQVKAASPTLTFEPITETSVAGNPAALVKASAPERDVLLTAVATSEAYILVIGTTAKGDLAAQQPLLMQIAATADYVKAAE